MEFLGKFKFKASFIEAFLLLYLIMKRALLLIILFIAFCLPQTTITVDDLSYDIGGYYSMYNFPSPQGVIGLTGNIGGPQVFDFSDEMPSIALEFSYVDVNDGGHGGNFPDAEIAEKRIDGNNSSWMYLKFEDGVGRHNFGFYDSINLPDSPSVSFSPSIVDFPDNLTYQSYFTESTNFNASLGSYDLDIEYSFTGFVDGYGSCVLPDDLGTYDCIQINYSEEYVYYFYNTPIQYSYIRSYYYLAEDIGIVTIITSLEDSNSIPNDFNIANTFARLYDTSKIVGLVGDINNDEVINVLDVVMIVNIVLSGEYNEIVDINYDSTINILDIIQLANMILSGDYSDNADLNSDGVLNILDIVQIVNIILSS
jgi:hypothetical protein